MGRPKAAEVSTVSDLSSSEVPYRLLCFALVVTYFVFSGGASRTSASNEKLWDTVGKGGSS